ncbi:hypothetical protein [Streptomyces avermitilis]|uniref:HTTM domain-containing protein n=2 Tax=Streptomyces avermitilis TaxID=33903 RepID=A0A143SZG2_STRAW|nr:hypothetical protein [Streptomyces avermitilis]BAU77547.1 hypothetical protein SAVERM_2p103 [Streptomyces avermitilis MA-4680 = NBRC 14893]
MWLFHELATGFSWPVHDSRIQMYRILLAAAALLKALATLFLGDWNRLRVNSFGRFRLERTWGAGQARLISAVHKPLVLARLLASVLLLVGIEPKAAIAILLVGFGHELCYEYRFNTIYIATCLCFLLPAGSLGTTLGLSDGVSTDNAWSQFLIVLLTVDVYWNSAYQKLRSRQFRTGLSLVQQAYIADTVRPRIVGREYWHPPTGVTAAMAAGAVPRQWRALPVLVIMLEILLPIGLLVPVLRPFAVAAGIALHLGFLSILPLRLAPFTLASLATYLLFVP